MSNKNIEFKDSGIPWIGQIPKHWEIKRLKFILNERKENNKPVKTDFILSLTNEKGVIPYSEKGAQGNISKDDITGYKLAYPNDIILNSMNVVIGSVGLSSYFGAISPVYYALYSKENSNIKFYNYVFQTSVFQNSLKGLGNGILEIRMRIPMSNLNNVFLPLPPLNEQKKIAEFLDKKCEIIDKRLSNLERKIKSLKEYKKSLISECVTKGLNPKNMEFKDSKIPWIGQIPKHWEVTKIKMYYKVILGKMLANNPSSIDDTLENYLSAINIKFEGVNTSEQKQMFFNKREKELYLLKQGDVLISEGGDAGTACVYNNEFYPCYIQNAVHKVITKNSKKAINKFLYYWIFFIKSVGYVNLICNKATLMHFTKEKVENNFIFLPPLNEQKEIAEFLDKKCEKIDRLNENYTKQITALKEYKKSLIYECVTGKKEI
ncbi:restriction endonuclease subunit S [Campylobacter devanensis]|uniref:restriction endonuclease subunit S n=1 Tax=Campylobacter devanensis TaxID=3161138 RepID=UPI000A35ACE9|nr:restriction endonuclease subunit S [Campylobacter sp. P0098]